MTPANEPDANDKRSDKATIEPPGDIDRADTLEPAKEVISDIAKQIWKNLSISDTFSTDEQHYSKSKSKNPP